MDAPLTEPTREPRLTRVERANGKSVLSVRRATERQLARARVVGRATTTISPEIAKLDPLNRGTGSRLGRIISIAVAVTAALLVHGMIVVMAVSLLGGGPTQHEARRQTVSVEVRERPKPPPPPPPEPPKVEEPKRERLVAKAPPPAVAEPPPETSKPPPRIVGLSLESTVEGGGGPAFAVGNTREGKTAERAVDPKEVPKVGVVPEEAPAPNQVASRIPVAGVAYTLPKRMGGELKPDYPPNLKAQGIEADVTVMVSIDQTGKVTNVRVLKPAPYDEFNEAARVAARKQAYEPATKNGQPIPNNLTFTYRFRLEEQ
jgi:protein TonB